MPIIKWTEELSVGVNAFDNDHKKLIELFNKLYDALSQGEANNLIPSVLKELSDYTKSHFKKEENVLVTNNYPGYLDHKKLHDEFVANLQDLQEKFQSGNMTLGVSMFNLLTTWIKNHIKQIDKKYTEYLNLKGIR